MPEHSSFCISCALTFRDLHFWRGNRLFPLSQAALRYDSPLRRERRRASAPALCRARGYARTWPLLLRLPNWRNLIAIPPPHWIGLGSVEHLLFHPNTPLPRISLPPVTLRRSFKSCLQQGSPSGPCPLSWSCIWHIPRPGQSCSGSRLEVQPLSRHSCGTLPPDSGSPW
jgi:hypothetical protein